MPLLCVDGPVIDRGLTVSTKQPLTLDVGDEAGFVATVGRTRSVLTIGLARTRLNGSAATSALSVDEDEAADEEEELELELVKDVICAELDEEEELDEMRVLETD